MYPFKNMRHSFNYPALLITLMAILSTLIVACENKPVVKEAMEEGDNAPVLQKDHKTSTNVDETGDNMPGMPANPEGTLPGAE